MTSPYLGLRYDPIIRSDEVYLARVQEQDHATKQWRTLHWVKCLKNEPVGSPHRWTRFLVR